MSEYIPRLQEAIASAIHGVSREEVLRERDGKWSIAQVLEHLYLTYTGTVKGCERALASSSSLATPADAKQRLKTMVIVTLGYYPRGIEAPRQVHPKGIPVDQVVSDIQRQITLMDDFLKLCEQKLGKDNKLIQSSCAGRVHRRAMAQVSLAAWPAITSTRFLNSRKQYVEKENAPAAAGA